LKSKHILSLFSFLFLVFFKFLLLNEFFFFSFFKFSFLGMSCNINFYLIICYFFYFIIHVPFIEQKPPCLSQRLPCFLKRFSLTHTQLHYRNLLLCGILNNLSLFFSDPNPPCLLFLFPLSLVFFFPSDLFLHVYIKIGEGLTKQHVSDWCRHSQKNS